MSTTMLSQLEQYEPLEIIGNGSFGIIRKVRRKSDGVVLARKELNFERMSERDKKQIVSEVNILKDLNHEHIVRYHDRFIDRDAGILYILMEYCGGGDLSSVIKQCARSNNTLPEDKIWAYFYQLLLALQYCHSPHLKQGDSSGPSDDNGKGKRQQILHRDLKPENVFLDGNDTIKLGDFGLSKALGPSNLASTYVGTPYYMSPELMQEKSYDAKSDIWSLGCLIYELCALKPPFHEAQTHSELSLLIRNGRIPPLPKCYSYSLTQVIKLMLNLNAAMRPSTQQLLQHERLEFARKVSDTQKMLTSVKNHKAAAFAKERELQAREAAMIQRETQLSTIMGQKDAEIHRLSALVAQSDERLKDAVMRREEELRVAVMRREEEVRKAMAAREEEILAAVKKREEEINELWLLKEEELRKELTDAIAWVQTRHQELSAQAEQLEQARLELEQEAQELTVSKVSGPQKDKAPFEDVKNVLTNAVRGLNEETPKRRTHATLATPIPKRLETPCAVPGSAMKGIILTETGETLATPGPTGLTEIIKESPKVGLGFRKIFDFDSETDDDDEEHEEIEKRSSDSDRGRGSVPHSPTRQNSSSSRSRSSSTASNKIPPTRLRRPSIRMAGGVQRPSLPQSASYPSGMSNGNALGTTSQPSQRQPQSQRNNTPPLSTCEPPSTPRYDINDEENLPSPFLKRVERETIAAKNARTGSTVIVSSKAFPAGSRRRSNGNALRVMAAANSANIINSISPSPSVGNPNNSQTLAPGTALSAKAS